MKQVTQAVKSAVNAYLMARAYAEVQRKKVNVIEIEILNSASYYADPELTTRRNAPERITNPKLTYLLKENESIEYLLDVKQALIKNGYDIKPTKGQPEHFYNCPALTAEHLQSKTEWILIDAAAEMLGENGNFRHQLLCAGLDKYREFIDLTVRLVVNMPGFKNPLTGGAQCK